jgi:hypothetical protein
MKARGLLKSEGINNKSSALSQPSSGNRKIRQKNNSNIPLNSTQLEELISLAECEVWPVPVIHRVVEVLTVMFSVSPVDSHCELRRGKCEQLLLMLYRIATL